MQFPPLHTQTIACVAVDLRAVQNINKSLTMLGLVISALADKMKVRAGVASQEA